uniref:Uncharacterized protein n=1 Tax=Arundo donax TaxID=35708 RepID=A0A0A9GAX2_ARUDO
MPTYSTLHRLTPSVYLRSKSFECYLTNLYQENDYRTASHTVWMLSLVIGSKNKCQ